ncbi:NAD(P)/FAD-dependent oxidoreductase [Kineosporia sp. R_H_3]|uniref:NAD(P)/FAD-dependent oxidoreductase n=1 Tax=Kineosporia sp. R_H_3 TaxID=1961848 RepID=UPI000B4A875C|nr:FAD-dependent oxidoreductase [Kineosporia sp. R_H_3]
MRVVVVGAGHAGVEFADALRRNGFDGELTLLDEQADQPYQRPPLSKDQLRDPAQQPLPIRGEAFYDAARIELVRGAVVSTIDRAAREVSMGDGRRLRYDTLVLATGSQSPTPPWQVTGPIRRLRTLDDTRWLAPVLRERCRIIVIGAGYVGLEVAAAAGELGCEVLVATRGRRLMSRAVSAPMSSAVLLRHQAKGVAFRFDAVVARVDQPRPGYAAVTLADGSELRADVVLEATGVGPRTRLAREAGLEVSDGVLVDSSLRTSDPAIFAIGDCARMRYGQAHLRLESLPNATDQAHHLANVLTGAAHAFSPAPWFWSSQGKIRLQIAGLSAEDDASFIVGDESDGAFSVLRVRDGRVSCVESLNDIKTHSIARRMLSQNELPVIDAAVDSGLVRSTPRPVLAPPVL